MTTAAPPPTSLVENFFWLSGTQLFARLLRLATIIVVARVLSVEDYGLAALVLATNEIFHVLSHGSVSSKLVQADEHEVARLRPLVYSLSWLLAIALTLLQMAAALPMATLYGQSAIIAPLCLLALSYLLLPLATVQSAMLIRQGKLKIVARSELYQLLAETLLTLLMVLTGFGFWSLVLPKLLVVPVWVLTMRRHYHWRAPKRLSLSGWQAVMRFGAPLAINDLLSALRTHFSALLIGASLGIELLGLFYFAYNAGLGLSMSLIRSLNQVLFSHFCRSRQPRNSRNLTRPEYSYTTGELRLGIGVGMGTMIAAVMSQTLLAPYYVPLLFGERWVDAGALPLLITLCLSALPLPLASVASQLLRSYGRPGDDLWAQLLYTSLTMAALIIGIRGGLQGAALAILLSNLLFCPLFLHQVLRNSHKRKKFIAVKT